MGIEGFFKGYARILNLGDKKMNRGGFSWKRLLGVSSAKANLSRKLGVPLTKSGRQRKAGSGDILSILFTIFFDRRKR